MGQRLLEVLKTTDSLDRVRVYSTEDRYIAALPSAIPRFVTRSETRTSLPIFRSAISASQRVNAMVSSGMASELKRKVEVVEKFTLGEGISPATRSPG